MGADVFRSWTLRGLTFAVVGGAVLAFVPEFRNSLVAFVNDPRRLPALERDARVHFEAAAEACAQEVAALLPGAVARVEAAQGRPFAQEPAIGVFASYDNYARANGLGDAGIAAVSLSGRIVLSPTLCGEERARLSGILTHELSHAHFFGWRSQLRARPPSWFTEGLAVMVSEGGGAEGVTDAEAAAAMRAGQSIVVTSDGLWRDFSSIRFELEPPADPSAADRFTSRQRLAYRQAAMFVAWLRARDPAAFAALLRRLEDGDAFPAAFQKCFGDRAEALWRRFVSGVAK